MAQHGQGLCQEDAPAHDTHSKGALTVSKEQLPRAPAIFAMLMPPATLLGKCKNTSAAASVLQPRPSALLQQRHLCAEGSTIVQKACIMIAWGMIDRTFEGGCPEVDGFWACRVVPEGSKL